MLTSPSSASTSPRIAIVLCNLGGADGPESVRPFLFNLFSDRNILPLPAWLRLPLAWVISTLRAPYTRKLYDKQGGRSILMDQTRAQAGALEAFAVNAGWNVKVVIAMRYWHPFPTEAVSAIREFGAEEVLVLPLYPQFSGTTSGSVLEALRIQAMRQGLDVPIKSICCYPRMSGFAESMAGLIAPALHRITELKLQPRLLLSAHGLPERLIARGDPYQWQVEQSASAIHDALKKLDPVWNDLDVVVCYQSRVGPVGWIGPSTEDELARAGRDKRAVVLAPIAFVSEHLETVVELDETMKAFASEHGVTRYERVCAVGKSPAFIEGLFQLARTARSGGHTCSEKHTRLCPASFGACPHTSPLQNGA